MVTFNIDLAPTLLVLGSLGVLVVVLFFPDEIAFKRSLQLLEEVVKALAALCKLFNK
jgi:hypothetical protein